jgi:hypothetical protein
MADYLLAFWDDVAKQRNKARCAGAVMNSQKRIRKYVLREQHVEEILKNAKYDTDQDISTTLDLLAHLMQNYVRGLRYDNFKENEQANDMGTIEITDDEGINDVENDAHLCQATSSIHSFSSAQISYPQFRRGPGDYLHFDSTSASFHSQSSSFTSR